MTDLLVFVEKSCMIYAKHVILFKNEKQVLGYIM